MPATDPLHPEGHATTLAQILADELGVTLADTTVMPTGDATLPTITT